MVRATYTPLVHSTNARPILGVGREAVVEVANASPLDASGADELATNETQASWKSVDDGSRFATSRLPFAGTL